MWIGYGGYPATPFTTEAASNIPGTSSVIRIYFSPILGFC